MDHQAAEHYVERTIREGQCLYCLDLEPCGAVAVPCLATCYLYHLGRGINTVDRSFGANPPSSRHGEVARAAAHVQHPLAGANRRQVKREPSQRPGTTQRHDPDERIVQVRIVDQPSFSMWGAWVNVSMCVAMCPSARVHCMHWNLLLL